jgi:hypothetical protein
LPFVSYGPTLELSGFNDDGNDHNADDDFSTATWRTATDVQPPPTPATRTAAAAVDPLNDSTATYQAAAAKKKEEEGGVKDSSRSDAMTKMKQEVTIYFWGLCVCE